jgi:hypothetical protein
MVKWTVLVRLLIDLILDSNRVLTLTVVKLHHQDGGIEIK